MGKSTGIQRKSRKVFSKNPREKGMAPLGRLLHEYQNGEKVVIKIDSSVQKGMPHKRYYGKVGIVTEERGRAYVVEITEDTKVKKIITRPEHIVPYTG
jgi:large subunit ribosomal protein L21e